MKAMAVTGFVPNAFPAKHFQPGQAEALGERLKIALGDKVHAFENVKIEECWAYGFKNMVPDLLPSCANPPNDRFFDPRDMATSNIILLQRYEWMRLAATLHPDVDVFAWIEYTVLKQRNMTDKVLQDFMGVIEAKPFDAISLPGCWPKGPINDREAHWRFCGSCWVCPSKYLEPLAEAIKTVVTLRTKLTKRISWDMNSMAYVELLDVLPIRWYQANHDETQFTNF